MQSALRHVWLLAFLILACGSNDAQADGPATYQARGIVRALRPDPERPQVTIEHEPIEGLMPAMTMPFDLARKSLLRGLAVGNTVTFTLRVERVAGSTRYVIQSLQKR